MTAPPAIETPPATWQTAALACKRGSSTPCEDPTQVCAPVAAAPPGFQLCVYQSGDLACPPSFPEKHSVATAIDDQRGCAPCACGAPTNGFCTGTLTVFSDELCTSSSTLLFREISSLTGTCDDFTPPGKALGSKLVDKPKYLPGTCAPIGGEATGLAAPTGLATFCCRP